MINQHDITAISDLLRRTPMSPGEAIYASDLVVRLTQLATPAEAAPIEPAATPKPRKPRKPGAAQQPPAEPPIAPLRPNPLAGY